MSLPEAARRLQCPDWQVRNVFTRGVLPEPPRAGLTRVISERDLPKIEKALCELGYRKGETATAAAA